MGFLKIQWWFWPKQEPPSAVRRMLFHTLDQSSKPSTAEPEIEICRLWQFSRFSAHLRRMSKCARVTTSQHDFFSLQGRRPLFCSCSALLAFLLLTKESKLSLPAPGFLDQYSSSENGRIFSKVDKKVSFKWDSPWILQSFEIKWVIPENNYLKDHGKFLREIRLKCFKCYTILRCHSNQP